MRAEPRQRQERTGGRACRQACATACSKIATRVWETTPVKVGIIQNNPVTGDLAGNATALLAAVEKAARQGAELCIAPELALCGHFAGDLLLQPSFVHACRETLEYMAASLASGNAFPPLLLGAPVANPVPQGKPLQNCAVLLHDSKVTVISRKVLLPSEGIHDDTRYFEPGVSCGVLHHKGWRFAVTVGEDVWNDRTFWQDRRTYDADPVSEFMGGGGADGLINLTALPYAKGLPSLHQRLLGWLAAHYRVPVLAANLAGGNDSLVYYGGSLAFDGDGTLAARAPAFEEAVLIVNLAGKKGGVIAPELRLEEELWRAVVVGTRDFARKCGLERIVLGLSGGIDSALVAAIAAEALGADRVTGLLMPSPYSSRGSVEDSLALAKNLGIATHTLAIGPVMRSFTQVFEGTFPGGMTGLAEENIQARIRGSLLMLHANSFGALVLNTGNKSEAAMGYCTLYGDTVGGLDPIGDLYKQQVYALCRWYNEQRADKIPQAILQKAPSAELRPGQKDSDSLPPYEELDPLLYEIIEQGRSPEELIDAGHSAALVERVFTLLRRSEFKRHQAPPSLQLTARGFGNAWRMPIAVANTRLSVPHRSENR